MSWVEKIQTDYIITLGDGNQFTPYWLNATKKVEYNVSEFDFPELSGTLVKRKKPRGTKYGVEIYFTGEDNLEVAKSFQTSAADERAWTIEHPKYGRLVVQPTGLNFDDTEHNVTKITGTVIETITEDAPKTTIDPLDNIALIKARVDDLALSTFDVVPSASDKNTLTSNNKKLYSDGIKTVSLAEESEGYFDAFNKANSAILTATAEPLAAMRLVQSMINAPALFQSSVRTRIGSMKAQFATLTQSIIGATLRPSKKIYEVNSSSLISAMAVAAVNPLSGDYLNRNDVLEILDLLVAFNADSPLTGGVYPAFLYQLDQLQTANGGDPNSYFADAQTLSELNELMTFTVSKLFDIALGAKQERTFICTEDTNIILLTHRFYGLDVNDENLDIIINNNKIGISEFLQVQKGRKITYYV